MQHQLDAAMSSFFQAVEEDQSATAAALDDSTQQLLANFKSSSKRLRELEREISELQEPKKRMVDADSTLTKCRPWNYPDFLTRLRSFRETAMWFAKPAALSAVECALLGWSCSGYDQLTCRCCGAEIYDDSASTLCASLLSTGHVTGCGWGLSSAVPGESVGERGLLGGDGVQGEGAQGVVCDRSFVNIPALHSARDLGEHVLCRSAATLTALAHQTQTQGGAGKGGAVELCLLLGPLLDASSHSADCALLLLGVGAQAEAARVLEVALGGGCVGEGVGGGVEELALQAVEYVQNNRALTLRNALLTGRYIAQFPREQYVLQGQVGRGAVGTTLDWVLEKFDASASAAAASAVAVIGEGAEGVERYHELVGQMGAEEQRQRVLLRASLLLAVCGWECGYQDPKEAGARDSVGGGNVSAQSQSQPLSPASSSAPASSASASSAPAPSKKAVTMSCAICGRCVSLRSFLCTPEAGTGTGAGAGTGTAVPRKLLDPLGQHRHFCPWVSAPSALPVWYDATHRTASASATTPVPTSASVSTPPTVSPTSVYSWQLSLGALARYADPINRGAGAGTGAGTGAVSSRVSSSSWLSSSSSGLSAPTTTAPTPTAPTPTVTISGGSACNSPQGASAEADVGAGMGAGGGTGGGAGMGAGGGDIEPSAPVQGRGMAGGMGVGIGGRSAEFMPPEDAYKRIRTILDLASSQ
ncbi:hypothetical protein B484DRAFT_394477 [Ochromonadaceae sp. CCMP2298]|nr:hypothetical protein B484DRAFT_394477 [Ochromonadaceae sp. CCMP2298]